MDIFLVIWFILIFARCDDFFFFTLCASSVFFIVLGIVVVHSCVPSHVLEVSCSHYCMSQCRIVARGKIINAVMRFIPFPIRLVVCGYIIIVSIGAIKEGKLVAFPYVYATWVVSRQPVRSTNYVLWDRKRYEVLAINPSAGAKTHKVVRSLCVAYRTERNGAHHTGLHCVVM